MEKPCDVPGCDATASKPACALSQLEVGCCGTVQRVGGDPELKRRLLEMGFCNGASIEVLRRAPLGDPIEFKLRGYCLSLRGEQAKFVQINQTR
jgi:ferrous iron transport protein A